jgi:hypothetical protein
MSATSNAAHDELAQRTAPCALTTRRATPARRERGENNEIHTFFNGIVAMAAYSRSFFQ